MKRLLRIVTALSLGLTPQGVALAGPSLSDIKSSAGGLGSKKENESSEASKVQITPEAFQTLTPQQQELVRKRMQTGAPASSETREVTAGEHNGPEPAASPIEKLSEKPVVDAGERSDMEVLLNARPAEQGLSTAELRQFGYEMFTQAPSTFAPIGDAPVPAEYVLGPGDEIIVSALSPRRRGDYSLVVNRDGTIFYPNIGALSVGGLSFEAMTRLLTQKIKGNARDLQLSVRLGKLRTIQIFLVGQVKKPGAYTIGAFSTLSNALLACGGPTKAGTLRDIQVKRGGRIVTHFDYYDFLLKGESAQDVRLQSGDVLFVPQVGPRVAVAGNVKVPAIYELKGATSLEGVLALAGRITPMGYAQQVQIEQTSAEGTRIVLDVDLAQLSRQGRQAVRDGDLVKVFSLNQKLYNMITVAGNVMRPGAYAHRAGLRVRDVIRNERDLKPESYMDFALIERRSGEDEHIELLPFHLGKALKGDAEQNKLLQPDDTLRVYYRYDVQERPVVRLEGAINKGGEFQLYPNMTVAQLIYLGGGLKDEADWGSAELTRVRVVNNKLVHDRRTIDLRKALAGNLRANLVLEKDDHLLIKPIADYKLYRRLTLQGEISQPGSYTFQDGETLSQVIARAGGVTQRAYLKGAIFTRASVKKQQEERLKEISQKLEADVYRESGELAANSLSADALQAAQAALASKKALLASLQQTQASGRMIIKLDRRTIYDDVVLEEGDTLIVPPLINSVSVLGQVFNPTAISFEPGWRLADYLAKTGGPNKNADLDSLYVIRADGSVATAQTADVWPWPFSRGLADLVLEPGDTVVVPERIAVNTSIRDVRDITQILFQITNAAALTWGILRR